VLDLVADVVSRPTLAERDFERVRDLRRNRLRQLSRSAGAIADRAFARAVYGEHPYGHGALGTTTALDAMTCEDVQAFWAEGFGPQSSTLIVAGDVAPADVIASAQRSFGSWTGRPAANPAPPPFTARAATQVRLVDRPEAPQSVLRVGHLGPGRRTPAYPALVTLNAIIGGQFVSRINRNLREEKGITYGARTAFDFRRASGSFVCDTNVQADATAVAVGEILRELDRLRDEPVPAEEAALARASLTRGYVRHFETAAQLARGCANLATYGLDDGTFDRFVPDVEGVTAIDLAAAARAFVRPADAAVVVVGDAARCRGSLEALGRPVVTMVTEF
jgi:zinc protease